jgi:ketopantoate reductase
MEELVIWGAGAIDGTIGAALARAGRIRLLVDADAGHVAALRGVLRTVSAYPTPR